MKEKYIQLLNLNGRLTFVDPAEIVCLDEIDAGGLEHSKPATEIVLASGYTLKVKTPINHVIEIIEGHAKRYKNIEKPV